MGTLFADHVPSPLLCALTPLTQTVYVLKLEKLPSTVTVGCQRSPVTPVMERPRALLVTTILVVVPNPAELLTVMLIQFEPVAIGRLCSENLPSRSTRAEA